MQPSRAAACARPGSQQTHVLRRALHGAARPHSALQQCLSLQPAPARHAQRLQRRVSLRQHPRRTLRGLWGMGRKRLQRRAARCQDPHRVPQGLWGMWGKRLQRRAARCPACRRPIPKRGEARRTVRRAWPPPAAAPPSAL